MYFYSTHGEKIFRPVLDQTMTRCHRWKKQNKKDLSTTLTMAVGISYTSIDMHGHRMMMSRLPPLHRILEFNRQWRLGTYPASITS